MRNNITLDSKLIFSSYKIVICSVVMGITCYYSNLILFPHMVLHSNIFNFVELIGAIVINQIIYISMIFMLKVLTIDELKGYIK